MDASVLFRRIWLTPVAIVPIAAFAASDDGMVTVGSFERTDLCVWGYDSSVTGAYSPIGFIGGDTVAALYDIITEPSCVGGVGSTFEASRGVAELHEKFKKS